MKYLGAFLCFLILAGCQQRAANDASFKTIMIKNVGEVEALPDEAQFNISLYCIDRSISESKNCLVNKSNEITEKLQALGIDKNDILTTSVTMNRSYTWRNNSNVFEGFRSATSMIITVKNIERLSDIYTELLENPNLELGELSYRHSKIDSLKNAAYVQALRKSNILADKILEELPETNKEILKIGNVEITSSMPQPRDASRVEMEQAVSVSYRSMGINTGTVKINATLFVEYQID